MCGFLVNFSSIRYFSVNFILFFPIVDFIEKAKILLGRIKATKEKSHPEIENFLSLLKIYSIKDVGNKRDITIKIEDFHCAMTQTLGFSIKSFLGSDSTLFNPGPGTNFIYEISIPNNTAIDVEKFNAETYNLTPRISQRLKKLIEDYNAEIVFSKTLPVLPYGVSFQTAVLNSSNANESGVFF